MFCVANEHVTTYQYVYAAYWGTAFICGLCNFFNLLVYCGIWFSFYDYVELYNAFVAWSYAFAFQALVCIFELCLAVYASKGHSFPPPKLLANVFCCCCCCFPCLQFHPRMIHTLALANMAWFVQTILVPGTFVTVFFIILKAAQTIAIISLTMSGFLCAVTFASFIVYKYSNYERPIPL